MAPRGGGEDRRPKAEPGQNAKSDEFKSDVSKV